MTISANYPSVRPSLLLDFANTKQLDPRITYSRASTGTYYDGKTTAVAEQNLLLQSQEFGNAVWLADGVTVTANATAAPDGTSTAELLTSAATTAPHYLYPNSSNRPTQAGLAYTLSVYAKASGYNYVTVSIGGPTSTVFVAATFDLSAVAVTKTGVGGTGGSYVGSSITSVGSGWYRLTVTGSVTQSAGFTVFGLNSTGTPTYGNYGLETFAGDGTSGIYIWGAQLEQRSSVTAYTPTTTAPITNYIPALQTAAAGVPRFHHDPITGESKGFLIEEQRTNLLTYSEEFDNAAWIKNAATIAANTVVSPDGTLTGDKLVEGTTTDAIACSRTGLSFTAANTFTVYAKAGERRYVFIRCFASTGNYGNVTFDLQTGLVTQTNSVGVVSANGAITAAGNGWYRLSATVSSSGSAITIIGSLLSDTATPTFNTAGILASPYAGNGYSGIYIWGAQLEAGSFPTSYIPTVASQVTRSADSASMTGSNFSSWYRADEGTLYSEAIAPNLSATFMAHALNDGGITNEIRQATSSGGNITYYVASNNTTQAQISVSATVSVFNKAASCYKTNDFQNAVNGALGTADTSGVVPTVTQLNIGSRSNSTLYANGCIKKLAYYPKRLSNAQLQAITS